MPHLTLMALCCGLLLATRAQELTPDAILAQYVRAIGGEAALRAVSTRVSSGRFANDRGVNVAFLTIEKAPNKRVTVIGAHPIGDAEGSGRGFDGVSGWDKNFIGTGLRHLDGSELADLARDADLLRPLHMLDGCGSTSLEKADAPTRVLACSRADGRRERFGFDATSGLLTRHETELPNRRGVLVVAYDDYRAVGGVQIPHRVQFSAPGTRVTYITERIDHNVAIDDARFAQPSR